MATYNYFYRYNYSTQRPPSSPGLQNALKIAYYDKNGGSDIQTWRAWSKIPFPYFTWNLPLIRVYKGINKEPIFSPEKIYAVTTHELAHAAHWKLIIDAKDSNRWRDFVNADDTLVENWAVFMETLLTRLYLDKNYDKWPHIEGYYRPEYSSSSRSDLFFEIHREAGYTPKQLEMGLIGAGTLKDWKANLKSKTNGNEKKLDAIFKKYYAKN